MVKPADINPADPFKKALAEATKVLADDRELAVTYSVDPPGMSADSLRLPQVSRRMTRDEVLLARGTADGFALRHRHHDESVAAHYLPEGPMARDLYEAMENSRVEALGARLMPGTGSNIDARIAQDARRKGYDQLRDRSEAPLPVAAGYLMRELASGRPLPEGASHLLDLWRGFIEERVGDQFGSLADLISDQAAFARAVRSLIADLGYGDELGDDPDAEDDEDDDRAEEDEEEQQSAGDEDDDSEDAEASPERAQDETQDPAQAQVSLEEEAEGSDEEEMETPEGEAPPEAAPPPF